jgi:glyoxylase-like metal-dependent hydrolase (beta-lactamase superfamily II)
MSCSRSLAVGVTCTLIIAALVATGRALFVATETTVRELAPGVYFRKTQTEPEFIGCNQGWIVFKDYVLVIDANFPNQADEVIKLIRKQTDKPIRYVFDTHYHGDHADGNVRYVGASPVASERSRIEFETKGSAGFEDSKQSKPQEYGSLEYKLPDLYFAKKFVLDDGQQRVELLHFGHGHTMGDAVAWLPKHGILFTGDACVNGAFNYTGDSNTDSWVNVLNALDELPVKIVAPGHGEASDKSLISLQRRYFVELRENIRRMIGEGKTLNQIKQEIDLPFYKDWTGLHVRERTENIEHVYGELAG